MGFAPAQGGSAANGASQDVCGIVKTTTQSLNNNTDTPITSYDAPGSASFDYNQGSSFTADKANGKITVNNTGYYEINAYLEWVANGTGNRRLEIYKNGAIMIYATIATPNSTDPTAAAASIQVPLTAADYIQIAGKQTSGAGLNIDVAVLSMSRVR